MTPALPHRAGFVGIVGRTNAGKSTLLNKLANMKIAITSKKPQTTRNTIRAIVTVEEAQIIFVDTPGFHKSQSLLGQHLNKMIVATLSDVDVVLFLLDGKRPPGNEDKFVAAHLKAIDTPVIAALNKADLISEAETEERLEEIRQLGEFSAIVPVSAKTGQNVDIIFGALFGLLPESPQLYPPEMLTDQPEEHIVAEFIREKILDLTREEVPHSVAVVVEEMSERAGKDLIDIEAAIYVERDSQKGIIIGKGGSMLKEVGTRARRDIEALLGTKVNLKLWVGVEKDWRSRESAIKRLTEE